MLEKLGYYSSLHLGDEKKNIELVEYLCSTEDKNVIKEIVEGLKDKNQGISNDCIKVLYEIGERKPKLVSDYANEFLELLNSRNNRLVWGGMSALAHVAEYNAEYLFDNIDVILRAYENGSVITIDNSMTVLSKIAKANKKYEDKIFPILMKHLETCRIKEIPQHATRILICINSDNKDKILKILNKKKEFFTAPQLKRINNIIKLIDSI